MRPVCTIALCLAVLPTGAVAQNGRFDTSSLETFWTIHDVLRSDSEPHDSLWERLWASPGYALLQAKEQRRADLTRAMRLAWKPSLAGERDAARTAGGWVGFVLPHVAEIPLHRAALAAFVDSLSRADFMTAATEQAQTLLPAGTTARVPFPDVTLLYFKDARGFPERILLDPLYFMRITYRRDLLAHELHHYYRNLSRRPHRPYGSDLLAWTLENVPHEGIAGLLDKGGVPGMTQAQLVARYPDAEHRSYFEDYQVQYARSNEWLALTENTFERIVAHPDSAGPLGSWLHAELPDLGRIMGAFMAQTIIDVLGRDRVIAAGPDAWSFWRTCNEAARRSNGRARPLSERAMRIVDRIEAEYGTR